MNGNKNTDDRRADDRTEALPAERTAALPMSEENSTERSSMETTGHAEAESESTDASPTTLVGGPAAEEAPATEASGGHAAGQTAYDSADESAPTLPRPTGPHAPAIVLGLGCLVIAGLVLAQELGTLSVDWGNVGPLGIVAAGLVLVVLGLVGLLGSRRRTS